MIRAALRRGVVVSVGMLCASVAASAEPAWRVGPGEVRVTVPLKPGGAFEATGTALTGTVTPARTRPASLAGEIAFDLATLDTGISLRNQHLRQKYLEIGRGRGYDTAVLTDVVVNEAAGPEFEGRSGFTAMLLLHGVKRPVSGTAEVRRQSAAVRVDASFPLTLTDFSIVPPEYLGVGVANKLMVKVRLTARPAQ